MDAKCVSEDGRMNVKRVLKCKGMYESFCKFASNVFAKRRMKLRRMSE